MKFGYYLNLELVMVGIMSQSIALKQNLKYVMIKIFVNYKI